MAECEVTSIGSWGLAQYVPSSFELQLKLIRSIYLYEICIGCQCMNAKYMDVIHAPQRLRMLYPEVLDIPRDQGDHDSFFDSAFLTGGFSSFSARAFLCFSRFSFKYVKLFPIPAVKGPLMV